MNSNNAIFPIYTINIITHILIIKTFQAKIVRLVGEVDHAVERYNRLIKEKQEEQRRIVSSKLKAKGELLLEKNKDS